MRNAQLSVIFLVRMMILLARCGGATIEKFSASQYYHVQIALRHRPSYDATQSNVELSFYGFNPGKNSQLPH
jgi:hypothetical protein